MGKLTKAQKGRPENWNGPWCSHWRSRPERIGRTRDWKDCAHCFNRNVYRGQGVRVCAFADQPEHCHRYSYEFHPWLRADGEMWGINAAPEEYDALGLPAGREALTGEMS